MTISRIMPNICSVDVHVARDFYVDLLGLSVAFDSDWFVQLAVESDDAMTLGILRWDHESVTADARSAPAGVILTVVVDDADAAHRRAVELGADIVLEPHDTPYGQRRLLLRDPDGTVVDISAPTAQSAPTMATDRPGRRFDDGGRATAVPRPAVSARWNARSDERPSPIATRVAVAASIDAYVDPSEGIPPAPGSCECLAPATTEPCTLERH